MCSLRSLTPMLRFAVPPCASPMPGPVIVTRSDAIVARELAAPKVRIESPMVVVRFLDRWLRHMLQDVFGSFFVSARGVHDSGYFAESAFRQAGDESFEVVFPLCAGTIGGVICSVLVDEEREGSVAVAHMELIGQADILDAIRKTRDPILNASADLILGRSQSSSFTTTTRLCTTMVPCLRPSDACYRAKKSVKAMENRADMRMSMSAMAYGFEVDTLRTKKILVTTSSPGALFIRCEVGDDEFHKAPIFLNCRAVHEEQVLGDEGSSTAIFSIRDLVRKAGLAAIPPKFHVLFLLSRRSRGPIPKTFTTLTFSSVNILLTRERVAVPICSQRLCMGPLFGRNAECAFFVRYWMFRESIDRFARDAGWTLHVPFLPRNSHVGVEVEIVSPPKRARGDATFGQEIIEIMMERPEERAVLEASLDDMDESTWVKFRDAIVEETIRASVRLDHSLSAESRSLVALNLLGKLPSDVAIRILGEHGLGEKIVRSASDKTRAEACARLLA